MNNFRCIITIYLNLGNMIFRRVCNWASTEFNLPKMSRGIPPAIYWRGHQLGGTVCLRVHHRTLPLYFPAFPNINELTKTTSDRAGLVSAVERVNIYLLNKNFHDFRIFWPFGTVQP